MALYTVEAPDGNIVTLEGPDGASESDVIAQAQALYKPAPALADRSFLQRTFSDPFMRGANQLQQAGNIREALDGDNATGAMQDFIRNERDKAQYPLDPRIAAGTQEIVNAQGIGGTAKALYNNPRAIFNTVVESLASSAPSLVGGAVGTIGGGLAGSAVPVVGSVAGGIAGGMAGAGIGSYATEFANSVSDQLAQSGVDMQDPAAMSQMLADPTFRKNVLDKAGNRAEAVALFDALSMGVAGRIAGPVAKLAKTPVGKTVAGGTAEISAQAGIGGSGEAAAQLNSEGKITSLGSIALEGVGEIIPGIGEAAINTMGKKKSDGPAAPPPSGESSFNPDSFTQGQRGMFVYDGKQYEGDFVGFSQYQKPIFRALVGDEFRDLQVQRPEDIVGMAEPKQELLALPAPSSTLQAGAAGVGTESAYDSLRRQAGAQPEPLKPEERQPAAGAAYSGLQQQMAAYQQMEADRKAAQEDAVAKQREAQDREAIATKREKDLEAIADKKRATQYAGAVTDIPTALPRLTYDNTLLADKTGTVAPRQVFTDKAKEAKGAIAQRQEKRAADGFDATIDPPATVIDRAPLPPEPAPKAPSVPQASPDFVAGPLVKNRHADYTQPSTQQRRWIEGTVAELNDTSGGQRIFLDTEGQGGTQDVIGGKGNTPQWFSDYNKAAVRSQKVRFKAGKKNTLTEDSKKVAIEPATQILTRKQVTDVANKLLEGKPLGKSEVKVAEVIYAQAKSEREQNARQIEMKRADRSRVAEDELGDAAEPNLPPRDTSLDDIPFDVTDNSVQRFKSETAVNRVAAEKGVVTSKVIDKNGHYDPLTESNYFPEDASVAPQALEAKQKNRPKNNQWKKEKIEITLDDGSKQKVDAGSITGKLKKMANDLQKLKACLG